MRRDRARREIWGANALLVLSGRRSVMGRFANGRAVQIAAALATALVLGLNAILLAQTAGVSVPFLG